MANPGQGTSKKARARRNKRSRAQQVNQKRQTTVTTTTTTKRPKRSKRNPNMNLSSRGENNLYLHSLKYPEDIRGIRIPDGYTMVPTGTWQTFYTYSLTANDNGIVGMWINPRLGVGVTYNTSATDATPDVTVWDGAVEIPGQGTSATLYGSSRVVSASLTATFTGNTSEDKGTICGLQKYVVNGAMNDANHSAAPNSVFAAINDPFSECYPVRNGARITYRPMDINDFHLSPQQPGASITGSCFGLLAHGMTPGATIMAHLCINWEGLPLQQYVGIIPTSAPTPKSEKMMNDAANWASNLTDKITPIFGESGNKLVSDLNQYVAKEAVNAGKKILLEQVFSNNLSKIF